MNATQRQTVVKGKWYHFTGADRMVVLRTERNLAEQDLKEWVDCMVNAAVRAAGREVVEGTLQVENSELRRLVMSSFRTMAETNASYFTAERLAYIEWWLYQVVNGDGVYRQPKPRRVEVM